MQNVRQMQLKPRKKISSDSCSQALSTARASEEILYKYITYVEAVVSS